MIRFDYLNRSGVLILENYKELKENDVITHINQYPVKGKKSFEGLIQQGEGSIMHVIRGRKELNVELKSSYLSN